MVNGDRLLAVKCHFDCGHYGGCRRFAIDLRSHRAALLETEHGTEEASRPVEDLDAEHSRFEAEGLDPNPLKEMFREGEMLARFFFVQDPDGYKIEVIQQRGRYL